MEYRMKQVDTQVDGKGDWMSIGANGHTSLDPQSQVIIIADEIV